MDDVIGDIILGIAIMLIPVIIFSKPKTFETTLYEDKDCTKPIGKMKIDKNGDYIINLNEKGE